MTFIFFSVFRVVVDFWKVLAKESCLLDQVLQTCLDMLQQNMPYEEKTSVADKKKVDTVATVIPLSVSVILFNQQIFVYCTCTCLTVSPNCCTRVCCTDNAGVRSSVLGV